jgi:two-component system response regulator AtoC
MPKMTGGCPGRDHDRGSRCPGGFITGEGSEDTAVQAMKAGAKDYVTKPFSMQYLVHTAKKFIKEHELQIENLS